MDIKKYSGVKVITVDSEHLNEFHSHGVLKADKSFGLYPNQNIVLKCGDQASGLGIYKNGFIQKINDQSAAGIKPRSKEQKMALNMLLDPTIQCVSLTGVAGGGKTLLALGAALEQSIGKNAIYVRILYVKSLVVVGKDIGFLPGEICDKVDPFMGALRDSLAMCSTGKKTEVDKLTGWDEDSKIQIVPHSFLRGRTFRKSFIVADESQNLTTHEIKTILTRLDSDSKIILLGDEEQSDIKLKDEDKGLERVIETFKDEEMFGHITMIKSERSAFADLVAKKLK